MEKGKEKENFFEIVIKADEKYNIFITLPENTNLFFAGGVISKALDAINRISIVEEPEPK